MQSAASNPAGAGEPPPSDEQHTSSEHESSLAEQLRSDRERVSGEEGTTDVPQPVLVPEERS
jgi:hypothetical protein